LLPQGQSPTSFSYRFSCPRSFCALSSDTSLDIDVRGLEDWPPPLNFGLLQRPKGLRRLLFPRRQVETKVGELSLGRGFCQRADDPVVHSFDDRSRSSLWRPQCEPQRKIELGQSGFIRGRDLGRRRQAQRVAIRRRASYAARTHASIRAGNVLDYARLTERSCKE